MSRPHAIKALRSDAATLFLYSALSLFVEFMLIRYISVEVHIFAYFKNLALMACFLGLGLGLAWSNASRRFAGISAFAFLFLCGILSVSLVLHWNALTFTNPFDFMLFGVGGSFEKVPTMLDSAKSLLVMLLVFSLTTTVFLGMGQEIGSRFDKLSPLKAYSINVGGALFGSLLFTGLCSVQSPPGYWIAVAGILWLLVHVSLAQITMVAFGILHLWMVPYIARLYYGPDYLTTLWSPYYRIDVVRATTGDKSWGYELKVNYDTFQTILDCSAGNLAKFPPLVQRSMLSTFAHPYDCLGVKPKSVLVLASGNGSDVAAALRHGVQDIDAVDIDPVLSRLGWTMHPERPYADPRVHLHVMDARTYLQTCKKKYDLIVFAYLDSHTAFSSLSSLRTDNYIFTVESYKQAVSLLNDHGIVYVDFISFKPWLWNRHTKALAVASGMTPVAAYNTSATVGTGSMAAGPGLKFLDPALIKLPGVKQAVDINNGVPLATDDWPFLFMPRPELTWLYTMPLLMVLGFSLLFVARELTVGIKKASNWCMLFLGMGFMLLEVRAMADLSLLFGSTWIVNAAVISTILVMILIGNFIASRLQSHHASACAILLMLGIMAGIFIKPVDLLSFGAQAAAVGGTLLYLLPAGIAAILLALLFKKVEMPSVALAFNIFGGVVGISLEYLSMVLGIRALGWIAIALYAIVLGLLIRSRRATGTVQS